MSDLADLNSEIASWHVEGVATEALFKQRAAKQTIAPAACFAHLMFPAPTMKAHPSAIGGRGQGVHLKREGRRAGLFDAPHEIRDRSAVDD